MSTSYFAQATVMYAVIGLGVVLAYLVGVPNTSVTDAAGVVWQRTSIAEGTATVAIYTMLFATALSALKLAQGALAVPNIPGYAKINREATPGELHLPVASAHVEHQKVEVS